MPQNKGFLLVQMNPPAAFEEEFNAWYDTDHLAERLAVPGFESACRFLCIDGSPRYLAMYDLAEVGVLDTPDYLRVAGDNSNPWTRRVTRTARVSRHIGTQIHPGDTLTGDPTRVVLLRFRDSPAAQDAALVAALQAAFAGEPGITAIRLLATQDEPTRICFGWVEMRFPPAGRGFDPHALGPHADTLDMVNTYTRY